MDGIILPKQLVMQILDYLAKQPWFEVNNFITPILNEISKQTKKNKESRIKAKG